jgi:hypothetical protein
MTKYLVALVRPLLDIDGKLWRRNCLSMFLNVKSTKLDKKRFDHPDKTINVIYMYNLHNYGGKGRGGDELLR